MIMWIFLGFAGWNHTQLLGEISKGNWNLCKSSYNEFKLDNKLMWEKIIKKDKVVSIPTNEFMHVYTFETFRWTLKSFYTRFQSRVFSYSCKVNYIP